MEIVNFLHAGSTVRNSQTGEKHTIVDVVRVTLPMSAYYNNGVIPEDKINNRIKFEKVTDMIQLAHVTVQRSFPQKHHISVNNTCPYIT